MGILIGPAVRPMILQLGNRVLMPLGEQQSLDKPSKSTGWLHTPSKDPEKSTGTKQ